MLAYQINVLSDRIGLAAGLEHPTGSDRPGPICPAVEEEDASVSPFFPSDEPQPNSSRGRSRRHRGKRRPLGLRRKRRRDLGFETLEERHVMALVLVGGDRPGQEPTVVDLTTYDTSTTEGSLQSLVSELAWANRALIGKSPKFRTYALPNDPLFSRQWHLLNSGQPVGQPDFQPIFGTPGEDINVVGAWEQGYRGEGVVVAVIDDGVLVAHPDLAANIHPTLRFDGEVIHGATPNPNPDPALPPFVRDPSGVLIYNPGDFHGTAVAGLIAAVGNNGIGGTGVAPGAQIVPAQLITRDTLPSRFPQVFRYAIDQIDVTNNSWGPEPVQPVGLPTQRSVNPIFPGGLSAIRDSIIFGRDGLGVVHVFASGNYAGSQFNDVFGDFGTWSTAAYNGLVSTRYTIGVTGVDHDGLYANIDGTVTGYAEAGPSVLVAAPTGSNFPQHQLGLDDRLGSGITTTDLSGTLESGLGGYNVLPQDPDGEFDRDFLSDTNYTSGFNGTSAAAPIATGVVALMLSANPNLSWRDVQEILVRSARQNAQFERPANGFGQSVGRSRPNTWIVNQFPIFQDPDRFDPQIDPLILTFNPAADPNKGLNHRTIQLPQLANGAGYTVSQGTGWYGEQIGYGHGTVDADLAVRLASQWHTRNQNLPGELSITTSIVIQQGPGLTIPAGVQLSEAAGEQIVPGGLGGRDDFAEFWEAYFTDEGPVFDEGELIPFRGAPLVVSVPANNTMSVESVDVRLSISGGAAEALDHLRITLVSPEGTQSELNHFWVHPFDPVGDPNFRLQGVDFDPTVQGTSLVQALSNSAFVIGEPGSFGDGDLLVHTFNTKRSWGERSDDAIIFNPLTREPVTKNSFSPGAGVFSFGLNFDKELGEALEQGWELHFENFGTASLGLQGVEVVFHGSPIAANTQRVRGFVGIDQNQDDLFNYTRLLSPEFVNVDNDPTTIRRGEVFAAIDRNQEKFAANVRVVARRASDNLIIDEFITGHDGNYYFDLVPDDYILSVEDPQGRTAVDDSLSPANLLPNYSHEWRIARDFFQVWDYDENLRVPVNPETGAPFAWLDDNNLPVEYGMRDINFLLDPGPADLSQATFGGAIFADLNSDGKFNGDDYAVPDVTVYVDVNQNGRFDPGEIAVRSREGGAFALVAPLDAPALLNIGVIAPTGWTPTNPTTGLQSFFVRAGSVLSNVDFFLRPPTGGSGSPGSTVPGLITGLVFDDLNRDSIRQSTEGGLAGFRIYLDNNASGVFDDGDRATFTTANGSYVFSDVTPGSYRVRIDLPAPLTQTRPTLGQGYLVTLLGGGTLTGLQFGVNNPATLDYGDLPAPYPTRLAQNGARHGKGAYFLGTSVDSEFDGRPTSTAEFPQGDNTVGTDEDGIVVNPLVAGATGLLVATASRHGGYLQGWMDFNSDGDFNDAGERVITNKLLAPGPNAVSFAIPGVITGTTVYARFRYGEFGINAATGAAQIGEVEDYALPYVAPTPAAVAGYAADFDNNARVDGFDFLAWQRGLGTSASATRAHGDANRDGDVDAGDLSAWSADFGEGDSLPAVAAPPVNGDFDLSGDADGFDFLTWQLHVGAIGVGRANGDGDGDGRVGAVDKMIWELMFGLSSGAPQGVFSASVSSLPRSAHPSATPEIAPLVVDAPQSGHPTSPTRSYQPGALSGIARGVDSAFASEEPDHEIGESSAADRRAVDVALAADDLRLRRAGRTLDENAGRRRRADFAPLATAESDKDDTEDRAAAFEQLADELL